MNDTDLATLVRDAVRDTRMTVPESDITRRARKLRTRRRVAAGGAVGAGLAATALAVATLAAPASSPAAGQAQKTAQLTAWTVTKDPGGVIDVTIRELKDPAGLQARLRADGVPATVSFSGPDPACRPYYPDYRFIPPQYLLALGKASTRSHPWTHSYDNGSVTVSVTGPADLTLALRPARMPRGTAFQMVALRGSVVAWGLVKTSPACTGLYRITGEDKRAAEPVVPGSGVAADVGLVSGYGVPGSSRATGGGRVPPCRVHGTESAAGFAGLRHRRPGSRRGEFCSGERRPVKPERRFERVRRAAADILAADLGAGRVHAV